MGNQKETFWLKVPEEEKPGLVTLGILASAVLIFAFGISIGKYML
jgi:hypothetical protein